MVNQLSREALIIYLRNLRTLEFIKKGTDESLQKVEGKKRNLEMQYNSIKSKKPEPNVQKPKLLKYVIILIIAVIVIDFLLICLFCFLGNASNTLYNIWGSADDRQGLSLLEYIGQNIGSYINPSIAVILIGFIIIALIYNKSMKDYEADCKRFAEESSQYNKDISHYGDIFNKLQKEADKHIQTLQSYITIIDSLLQKAYNLDIVPLQFRGIYGVTYLYDFISTSDLSLSDAIINCNMEQIKDKFDIVISKCNEIINQQKITNANLREIQRQNNQLLAEARNTSRNTALAAQYSEIAATNSAVALELQKKQLAYQEVDFWLNSV